MKTVSNSSWALDRKNGTSMPDYFRGTAADDVYHGFGSNDWILGSIGNDRLYGDAGDDHIEGGSGNDTLYGGAGADTMQGSDGNDRLFGGSGDDRINPYFGNDVMTGGTGSDIFEAADTAINQTKIITDFRASGRGHDFVELHNGNLTYSSFGEMKDRMTEHHGNVYFKYGEDDVLVFRHMHIQDLSGHDFLIG